MREASRHLLNVKTGVGTAGTGDASESVSLRIGPAATGDTTAMARMARMAKTRDIVGEGMTERVESCRRRVKVEVRVKRSVKLIVRRGGTAVPPLYNRELERAVPIQGTSPVHRLATSHASR